jgi:hypothetical protein
MEYIKQICKMGQGKDCCRYLMAGAKGFICGKHTSAKPLLDERVATNTMIAQGDNCGGYPSSLPLSELSVSDKPNLSFIHGSK